MAKKRLSHFEKVRVAAQEKVREGRSFSGKEIKEVIVDDWTDENGQPQIIEIIYKDGHADRT